jgi:inner membrane protein
MASIGHIAVGMAAARAERPGAPLISLATAMISWSLLSLLPDADVLGFRFGVPYAHAWPFDQARYFAPLRPIPVAPIAGAFFTRAGLRVAAVELCLFAPLFVYALWPRAKRTNRKSSL